MIIGFFHQVTGIEALKRAAIKRVFIKADACDIQPTLMEAQRKQTWSGDVDMGDGSLQELRVEYEDRRKKILRLLDGQTGLAVQVPVLNALIQDLQIDTPWLRLGLTNAINNQQVNTTNIFSIIL